MTKLGLHVTTGSRNGYNLTAPHARGLVSFLADAFVEAAETTYRVWRFRYEYNGQTNDDIMPGFDALTVEQMAAQAAYWWPIMRDQAAAERLRLGVRIDAIKATNEVGGNDRAALEKLIAYELALMTLAEADGWTLVFGNFASASPHWEIWEELCAPFVQEGWQRGHVYSRHAYIDIGDYYTHMERPFRELDSFDEPGPTILGEVGFVAFPGTSTLISMLEEYDTQLALYPEIGFGAIFTYGQWNNANIQNASTALGDYLRERPFEPWYPHYDPSTPPPPGERHKAIVVKCPQDIGRADFLNVAAVAYDFRHTLTLSHDDMLTILRGGNGESYVKASHPARDQEALALVEAAGYRWEPLTAVEPPPPPPPPPPGQMVDLRPYFRPTGTHGYFYTVADLNGAWTMDMQLQREADGSVVMVKGHEYERWNAAGDYLRRYEDTSPGSEGGRRWAYTQEGANWIPLQWRVGSLYARRKMVTRLWVDNCAIHARDEVTDYIRFYDLIPAWVSPANEKIVLQNVIELRWVRGPQDTGFIERYLLAAEYGYVSWQNEQGQGMAIVDVPQGRPPLRRERICWN